jgi:hypothetical protein
MDGFASPAARFQTTYKRPTYFLHFMTLTCWGA